MANPVLGRECTIKKNDIIIGYARDVSVTVNGTVIDITSLGDEWARNLIGQSSYDISFEYLYELDETSQDAIEAAALGRTTLDDIEIYVDATTYYGCDAAGVTAGTSFMTVSSWGLTFNNDNAVSVPVTLTGSGPLEKQTQI